MILYWKSKFDFNLILKGEFISLICDILNILNSNPVQMSVSQIMHQKLMCYGLYTMCLYKATCVKQSLVKWKTKNKTRAVNVNSQIYSRNHNVLFIIIIIIILI